MSHPVSETGASQMSIGLIAYGMDGHDPSKVLVRLPTERGRWVLTDRCVVEVPCSCCGAVVGEPCRRGRHNVGHGAGTHAVRRYDWKVRSKAARGRTPVPKLRVRAEDMDTTHPDDMPEVERLRAVLERIAGYTLSQFAGPHDMACACVDDARQAINGEPLA